MAGPLRGQFDQALQQLQESISDLGNRVEESIRDSVLALAERRVDLAEQVIEQEVTVNKLHDQIEDSCVRLIATEQPVATDLRRILGALNVLAQLERIGDLAVHVARVAQRLAPERLIKELIDIPFMADATREMIRESVAGFIAEDNAAAERVSAQDSRVDELYSQVFRELLTYMMEDPRNITQATSLLFVAKQLERAGDHTTNICEATMFVTTGKHVDLNR